MAEIRGVITAMVTPFDAAGAVDLEAARRLAVHLAENGSHGVVVAGTTGESPTLSDGEKLGLLDAVRNEVGERLTVICGTGSNDASFLRCLEQGGVGGILVSAHLVGAEMRQIYESILAGDHAHAAELDAKLRPVYEATMVTANPIPVKAALEMLGLIEGHLRLPMVPASQEERATIRAALERQGLLVAGGPA